MSDTNNTNPNERIYTQAEKDVAMRRVKALMAKNIENGCTMNEAIAAMEAAAKIRDKYGISSVDLQDDALEFGVVTPKAAWHGQFIERIAFRIAEWCGVCASRRQNLKTPSKKDVRYFGEKEDVAFAVWLTQMLSDFAIANAVKHKGQMARKSYIIGVSFGINDRLKAMIAERREAAATGDTTNALVVKKQALVEAEMHRREKFKDAPSRRSVGVDMASFNAGKDRAKDAIFNRPLGSAGNGVKALNYR